MCERVTFDGDNSYPACEQCGHCCQINILAVTHEEYYKMRDYVLNNDVVPHDHGGHACCFQNSDHTCMIWEARPQTCKLHNCHVARRDLIKLNPLLQIPSDPPLLNLHEAFINNNPFDPRYTARAV